MRGDPFSDYSAGDNRRRRGSPAKLRRDYRSRVGDRRTLRSESRHSLALFFDLSESRNRAESVQIVVIIAHRCDYYLGYTISENLEPDQSFEFEPKDIHTRINITYI